MSNVVTNLSCFRGAGYLLASVFLVSAACGDQEGQSKGAHGGSSANTAGVGGSASGSTGGTINAGGSGAHSAGSSGLSGTGGSSGTAGSMVIEELSISAISPSIIDPMGGSHVAVTGVGFAGIMGLQIGGVAATQVEVISSTQLRATTAVTPVSNQLDVVVTRDDQQATLVGAVEVWSPAEIPGARLFDAANGVQQSDPLSHYEWQQLTANISDNWRVRDGNTLTWLPSTGRYWMVGGWNGYQEPDGFSSVPPDSVYPPENTTTEVWSTVDGVDWQLELEHGNQAFERRHAHNMVLWNDRLWMIGGDMHQGYYNHDVVSSADGVNWTQVLPPGSPPWEPRSLQISGVYNGRLWTMGGQESHGDPATMRFFNDVWSTEDGENWVEVAPDGPASETRWGHCGAVHEAVEFQGEMWIVGCGCDTSSSNCGVGDLRAEVWSTTNGVEWTRHTDPPWAGKTWHNVVVWDNKLWVLFGYTFGDPANGWPTGNSNEVWYSPDGETWTALPHDSPEPGSHAQGVAVRDDSLLYAGGNYSFGFGAGEDKSVWRLVPFKGKGVASWADRGPDSLVVYSNAAEQQPLLLKDAFGPGADGLHFDGSNNVLDLEDEQGDFLAGAHSIFWVARAPYLPAPWGWEELTSPLATIVGGSVAPFGLPVRSVGLSGGQIVVHAMDESLGPSGETLWTRIALGSGLQQGPGIARFAGITQSDDGTMQAWIDGAQVGDAVWPATTREAAWRQIGGSMNDTYYGPNTRFAGTLGTVVIIPTSVEQQQVTRLYEWARGRFYVP